MKTNPFCLLVAIYTTKRGKQRKCTAFVCGKKDNLLTSCLCSATSFSSNRKAEKILERWEDLGYSGKVVGVY